MIKLYAIEPEAILNPRVQQALEAFEFCQGRIVGCVPKGWKKRVYEIFDEQPHGKEREALKKTLEILFRKRAVKKIRLPIAKGDHWLAQAASIDEQELNGILVTTVPELGDEVSDSRIFDC